MLVDRLDHMSIPAKPDGVAGPLRKLSSNQNSSRHRWVAPATSLACFGYDPYFPRRLSWGQETMLVGRKMGRL